MTPDCILPSNWYHPPKHKLAAVRYLESQIKVYPLSESDKEMQIIKKILYNYQFMTDVLTAKVKKEDNSDMQNIKNSMAVKWATFTYIGE